MTDKELKILLPKAKTRYIELNKALGQLDLGFIEQARILLEHQVNHAYVEWKQLEEMKTHVPSAR